MRTCATKLSTTPAEGPHGLVRHCHYCGVVSFVEGPVAS